VVQAGRGTSGLNEWRGNYWDDYQGFDRDGTAIGDTPYELYAYADQIWIEMPAGAIFQDGAGNGTAGFPGAAGAFFVAGVDAEG